jgi:hypothetical protein
LGVIQHPDSDLRLSALFLAITFTLIKVGIFSEEKESWKSGKQINATLKKKDS